MPTNRLSGLLERRGIERPDPALGTLGELEEPRIEEPVVQQPAATNRLSGLLEKRGIERSVSKSFAPRGEPKDRPGFFAGLGQGIKELRPLPFIGGLPEIAVTGKEFAASRRAQQKTATREDLEFLLERQRKAEFEATGGIGYKVGRILSELPAFAIEIALTGGLYSAGKKTALKGAEKVLGKAADRAIGKALVKTVGVFGGAATQSALGMPHRVAAAGLRRATADVAIEEDPGGALTAVLGNEGDDFFEALIKGYGETVIEVWSERTGVALGVAGRASSKALGKIAPGLKAAIANRWLKLHPGSGIGDFLKKVKSSTQWHGVLGEMFEERVGEVARAVTGLEEFRLPSWDQLIAEGVAFSVPGAGMSTLNFVSARREKAAEREEPPPAEEPAPEVRPVIDVVTGEEQPTPPGLVAREAVSEAPEEVLEPVEPEPPVEAVEEPVAAPEEAVELQEEEVRRAVEEREVEEGRVPERERVGEVREIAEAGRRDIVAEGREIEEAAPTEEVEEVTPRRRGKRFEVNEALRTFRRQMKSRGIEPPVKKGKPGFTAEDFGGDLPKVYKKKGGFVWDQALQIAEDLGLPIGNNDPSDLRKLLIGSDLTRVVPEEAEATGEELIQRVPRQPTKEVNFDELDVGDLVYVENEWRRVQDSEKGAVELIDGETTVVDFFESIEARDVVKPDDPRYQAALEEFQRQEVELRGAEKAAERGELFDTGKEDADLFDVRDFAAEAPVPLSEGEVFFKGDRAERTGKKEKIAGANFFEVKMLEGANKGELRLISAEKPLGTEIEVPSRIRTPQVPTKKRLPGIPVPKVTEQQQGEIFRQDITLEEAATQAIDLYGDKETAVKKLKGQRATLKQADENTKRVDDIIAQLEAKPVVSLEERLGKEGEEPIRFSGIPPEKITGNAVENVETAIAPLRKLWKGGPKDITVVGTMTDAPKNIQDAAPSKGFRGAYDPNTDTVYLVADQIQDAETAAFVAMHEVVGHRGIEAIIGKKQSDQFYDQLAAGRVRDISKRAKQRGLDFKTQVDKRNAAREWLADKVNAEELGDVRKWWERLIDTIRKTVDRMTGVTFSEENLDALIRRAHQVTEDKEGPIESSDVRFSSPKEQHQAFFDKAYSSANHPSTIDAFMQAIRKTDKNAKPDLKAWDTILGTIQWYNSRVPALQKVWHAARRLRDNKHLFENMVFNQGEKGEGESDLALLKTFAKVKEWVKLEKYLWKRDRDAEGYWVKETSKKQFTVMSPTGKEVDTFEDSDTAWETAYQLESGDLRGEGFSEDAVQALLAVRHMNHRAFQQLEAEVEYAEKLYKAVGKRPPRVRVNEDTEISIFEALKRMGDRRGHYMPRIRRGGRFFLDAKKEGEPDRLEIFDTRAGRVLRDTQLTRQGWTVGARLSERPAESAFLEGNIIALNDLMNAALKRMQKDLRSDAEVSFEDFGYTGKEEPYVKKDGETETHFVLTPIEGERIEDQQFQAAKNGIKALGGRWFPDNKWHFIQPSKDLKKKLGQALVYGQIQESTTDIFGLSLSAHLAEVIHSRGSRARKLGRSEAVGEKVVRGFEENAVKALSQAGKATAGGTAKRLMAQEQLHAIAGTDVSWDEFLESEGHDIESDEWKNTKSDIKKELWDQYSAMVQEKRIDSATQHRAYNEAVTFAQDMIRNEEPAERVFGTIKGLAAIKYLSGIAPGVVNMTAMLSTVPAAMTSFGNIPHLRTPGLILKGFTTYSKHYAYSKWGVGKPVTGEFAELMEDISRRGFDDPLYNMEAIEALQGNIERRWSKIIEWSLIVFSETEQINRGSTIAAAYMGLKEQHKGEWTSEDHETTLIKAREISDAGHAVYGKENLPAWARGPTPFAQGARAYYMYRTFSHNYLQLLAHTGINDKRAAAWLLVSPALISGAGASLLTPAIATLVRGVFSQVPGGPPDDPEEEFYKWLSETFGETAERVARGGAFGVLGPGGKGVNLKGSLSIGITDLPTTVVDLLGAPASMVKDVKDGWDFARRGDHLKAAEKLSPRVLGGPLRAYREYTEGVTTRGNQPLFYGDERVKADAYATALRAMHFNPVSVSEKREKQWSETKIKRKYSEMKADINARFRAFLQEDRWDQATWTDIAILMNEFNVRVVRHGYDRTGLVAQFDTPAMRRIVTAFDKAPRSERLRATPEESELVTVPETFRELTVPRSRRRRRTRPTRPTRPTR